MNRIFLIVSIIVVLSLAAISISFFLRTQDLNQQVTQAKKILQKMQEEVKRIEEEKEKLTKESEKLQADAISYIGLNTDLQKDKDELEKKFNRAQGLINAKEDELKKLNEKLKEVNKTFSKEKHLESEKLEEEKKELAKKIKALEETLKKERGLYHYNLAVAYTQAELYDDAVDAYKKSLEFDPENPDAHYNVGLLYENFKGDPEMAATHYHKYLELKPNADDREEIEAQISRLQS